MVVGLDGTVLARWRRHAESPWNRAEDDYSFVEWSADGSAIYESEAKSNSKVLWWVRTLAKPSEEKQLPTIKLPSTSSWPSPERVFGVNPQMDEPKTGDIFLLSWGRGQLVLANENHPSEVTTVTPTLSPGTTDAYAYVSPDHRKILWQCVAYPARWASFWITNCYGRDAKPLGHIDLRVGNDWQLFGGIQWLPDGKSFSYTWNRNLYQVQL